jgi:SAM-dependent methyltransferase
LYFPFAKAFLKLAIKVKPELNIKSYVKSKFLTHDEAEQKCYDEDTLITPHIPARQLTTLLDTAQRVVDDAETIITPMLVLSARKDYVVESGVQGDFYAKLSSSLKRFVKLEGFYHGVLYETEHQKAIKEIGSFMEECYSQDTSSMLDEVIHVTQKEKDIISFGTLPLWKEASFFVQRFMMDKLGFMSDGMKIGLKYGFDSGVTLDHVYKNEPSGVTWIGKMLDKNYLESIGWKGIRQRKVNMIAATKAKIALLQEKGEKVRILDIAGGPARYLIEIAEAYPEVEVQVRDYQEQNVEEGRALAKERNLSNISYVQSDAFDAENYDTQGYRPNIVIISGVFELFEDNALIGIAMEGVSSIIQEEGYLLYTGQPWHPQLEQIANVLGNHQQEKWIMRRRSQYELDTLFCQRGFEKESMAIDDWGIFTVSSSKYTKVQ